MKNRSIVGTKAYIAAVLLAAGSSALAEEPATSGNAVDGEDHTVERGRYLVLTSGCHDCHTPWTVGPNGPEPDMSRMLSGHPESEDISETAELPAPWVLAASPTNTAWSGPWGVSFTANLTPDDETGLGKWSLKTFKETIRTGRHKGRGRAILPPMPIPMYKHFSDEDLEAIFAFLQTIPAVENQVPEPLPPEEAAAAAE